MLSLSLFLDANHIPRRLLTMPNTSPECSVLSWHALHVVKFRWQLAYFFCLMGLASRPQLPPLDVKSVI